MKIKICGLTDPKETLYVNRQQVDFVGIVVFFPKSKRNRTIEQARDILAALDASIHSVAVTVSPTLEQVRAIEDAGFHYIQIHGELGQELLEEIRIPVLRAFNVKDMDSYETYHACPQIAGYVFDAQEPGSGKTFDWNLVTELPRNEKLLLLAGGLNIENVQAAIKACHPDGVDCSSGVEYEDKPGKDPEKIVAFVNAVRGL